MTAMRPLFLPTLALALAGFAHLPVQAQDFPQDYRAESPQPGGLSYADLVALADAAPLVLEAKVTKQATVAPERAPDVAPGHARIYVEAETQALIAGDTPVGESLRYVVDLPFDAKGKVPKFRKEQVLLFARPVPGRPGAIQLVAPDSQLRWTPALEARVRDILTERLAADAPPVVTGVRDALSVAGTLAGESETQLFLATRSGDPASITVVRRPGMAPRWGVSFSEIVDQAAEPPAPDTLAWYRLACALPPTLPDRVNLSTDPADRARAAQDYALVRSDLGPCTRTRAAPPAS